MYEELVNTLRKISCFDCDPCDHRNTCEAEGCFIQKAADAIEDLNKQIKNWEEALSKQNENWEEALKNALDFIPCWIPVTERLPECDLGAEVGNIEWISCGMVHAGCFGRGGKYRDAYFRAWTDAGEGIDAKDADYWRTVTLPEPPKEET